MSLWKCFWKQIWLTFATSGVLKLFGDATTLIGPMAISQIIHYVSNLQDNVRSHENVSSKVRFTSLSLSSIIHFVFQKKSTLYLGKHDIFATRKKWICLRDCSFFCNYLTKHTKSDIHSYTLRRSNTFANSSSGILF